MPSPTKTLITAATLTLTLALALSACASDPEVVVQTVVVERETIVERQVIVTATPTPAPTATAIVVRATATPVPKTAQVIKPTAAPTNVDDYYVILENGQIEYFIDVPELNAYTAKTGGHFAGFPEDFFFDDLIDRGVVTPRQKRAYDNGAGITVPIDEFAVTYYKALISRGISGKNDPRLDRFSRVIIYYLDESLLTSASNPTPAPTPPSYDYYVVLEKVPDKDIGSIYYYADFPSRGSYNAKTGHIRNGFGYSTEFLLDYLRDQGVITSSQREAFYRGDRVEIPFRDISLSLYKLVKNEGRQILNEDTGLHRINLDLMFYHIDDYLAGSAGENESYLVIRDGSLETVVTDAYGNATRVVIDTIDVDELLDYLLAQGKITVEDTDAYGETRTLEVSAEDLQDLLDAAEFGIDLDQSTFEIDEQTVDQLGSALQFLLESD